MPGTNSIFPEELPSLRQPPIRSEKWSALHGIAYPPEIWPVGKKPSDVILLEVQNSLFRILSHFESRNKTHESDRSPSRHPK
jgi:hypothetical protein